ncbi:MAG: hypothetical protein NTX76_03165 [Alphaproteobacteria bacterium]|nr:hypothetical protein [Alphaproteobacteria bacterium]
MKSKGIYVLFLSIGITAVLAETAADTENSFYQGKSDHKASIAMTPSNGDRSVKEAMVGDSVRAKQLPVKIKRVVHYSTLPMQNVPAQKKDENNTEGNTNEEDDDTQSDNNPIPVDLSTPYARQLYSTNMPMLMPISFIQEVNG